MGGFLCSALKPHFPEELDHAPSLEYKPIFSTVCADVYERVCFPVCACAHPYCMLFCFIKKKGAGRWVRRFTATEAGACELAVKNGTEKDWPPTYNSQVKYVAPKMIRVPARTD